MAAKAIGFDLALQHHLVEVLENLANNDPKISDGVSFQHLQRVCRLPLTFISLPYNVIVAVCSNYRDAQEDKA